MCVPLWSGAEWAGQSGHNRVALLTSVIPAYKT